jgi:predicted NBD/HSP70 family sugar kinase
MDIQALTGFEKDVFIKLQKEGPLIKKALLSHFEYKSSTLNRVLASLVAKKVILETGQEESSGGRKPSIFDVNTYDKYIIGIDISRTYIYVVICDLKFNIKASEMVTDLLSVKYTPQNAVRAASKTAALLLKRCKLTMDNILGAGVGMVGPVDRKSGITGELTNFKEENWSHVPLKDMLEKEMGCGVYIDNGSYAAVLAEYLYGGGKYHKSISYFNCEVGIRSGYISSGFIIRAANFVEDSFSHTTINAMGERCYCGKRGCVSCYASTLAISENIRHRIKAGETTLINVMPQYINYRHVLSAAEKGDKLAIEELQRAGSYFGIGLANYITLLNPEYVVIDGPLVINSDIYYEAAVKAAKENTYMSSGLIYKKGGSFGHETIAVGAAAMFFEKYIGSAVME